MTIGRYCETKYDETLVEYPASGDKRGIKVMIVDEQGLQGRCEDARGRVRVGGLILQV